MNRALLTCLCLLPGLAHGGEKASISSGPAVGKTMPPLPDVTEVTRCGKNGICMSCMKRRG